MLDLLLIVVLLPPLVSAFVASPTLLSLIRYEINDISITSYHTRVKHQLSSLIPIQYTEFDICNRSRRNYLLTSASVLSTVLLPQLSNQAFAYYDKVSNYPVVATNTKEIAEYIINECNSDFLRSVAKSNYNFLYRGLSPEQSIAASGGKQPRAILLKNESFDLLDPSTYESNDAAGYFQRLEEDMITRGLTVKPSNSHMGTTCPKEASRWGQAVSVWPLGEQGVEFAWIAEGGYFWPNDNNKKQTIVTTSSNKQSNNKQSVLEDALQGDTWDIMFRADNGFIVVPAEKDEELRGYLKELINI